MTSHKKFLLYIVLSYLFSVLVHCIWVYQFYGYQPFIWNNQFMINTNDGYVYMQGANDLLNGIENRMRSRADEALPIITYLIAKILPFSLETIVLYLPAILSSLVVFPIILIAKELKQLEVGFITALLSSIAWSYYNRTLVGYYDTDMLNIVLPLFLLWSLIGALTTNKNYYLLITALDILAYRAWYPQSYALEFSFWVLIGIYAIYKNIKKKKI